MDSFNKKISIIMPAHNAARFISQTLDSVQAQTYQNWELCIALDNCSDETAKIVESHPVFEKVKIVNCRVGSPAGARNKALELADGDYIAFLDADDWWNRDKLSSCLNALIKNNWDLVWHDELFYFEKLNKTSPNRYSPKMNYYPELLFSDNCLSTSAVVLRNPTSRGLSSLFLFNEDRKFWGTEDYLMWIELARAGYQFGHIPEILGNYRIHESSVSANHAKNLANSRNVIIYALRHDKTLSYLVQARVLCKLFGIEKSILRASIVKHFRSIHSKHRSC